MKDSKDETRRSASLSTAASSRALADHQPNQQPVRDPSILLSLLYPFVDESKSPLPRCFNGKDKYQLLSLTHNDLRVHYKGQGKSHKDAAAVRAVHPIPTACGLYYFEVRIINKGRDGLFGIGLSQAGVSLNRLPGWDKFSYGYHGDDGHSFSFSGSGVPYGPVFSTSDVIGCGLNLVDSYCFYTKNGHNIGVAFTDLPSDLYPTVGLQTPGEVVEANFGQHPFVYNIYEDIKMAQQRIHSIIDQYCLPLSKTDYFNRLISSYLVHHGYSSTAESFNKITNQASSEDIESVKTREKILKLIMSGRVGEAIKQVHQSYPGLLDHNRHLLFLLKCRQFVEMVAGNDEVGCLPMYDSSLLRHYSATHGNRPLGSWSPVGRKGSCSSSTGRNSAAKSNIAQNQAGASCTPPHRTTPRESPRSSPRTTSVGFASYVSVNGAQSTTVLVGGDGERRSSAVADPGRPKSQSNSSTPSPAAVRRGSDAHNGAAGVSNGAAGVSNGAAGVSNGAGDFSAEPLDGLINDHANGCTNGVVDVPFVHEVSNNSALECSNCESSMVEIGHVTNGSAPTFDSQHATGVTEVQADADVEMGDAANDEPPVGVMSVDTNVALVHFGRELHQLAVQLGSADDRQRADAGQRLKLMQDAFSLMAYTDPWQSPLCAQLQPEQREPVAAALNSCILESRGFAAKPPLEIIFGHAQQLRSEMIKIGLGAAAFTDPLYYTTP